MLSVYSHMSLTVGVVVHPSEIAVLVVTVVRIFRIGIAAIESVAIVNISIGITLIIMSSMIALIVVSTTRRPLMARAPTLAIIADGVKIAVLVTTVRGEMVLSPMHRAPRLLRKHARTHLP